MRRLRPRGGKRPRAGRKPKGMRAGVPHRPRPVIRKKTPVHVTVKLLAAVGSLRRRRLIDAMRAAFRGGKLKKDFRICQFSIQRDHMHVMSEADSNEALARGIQGWEIRVARRLNRKLGRKGKVFADRFHAVPIRSPRQLRNTLCYLLNNGHRHDEPLDPQWNGIDPFSSAWHFEGWSHDRWREGLGPPRGDPTVAPAESWLLRVGWLRWGRIAVGEVPRAAGPRAITRAEWLGEPA
jgi:REP element-mobilizing transposase RayT